LNCCRFGRLLAPLLGDPRGRGWFLFYTID